MYELLHRRLPISDRLERIGATRPERLLLAGALFGVIFMTIAGVIVIYSIRP